MQNRNSKPLDFSAARNYSFSRAQMDYCMWLDADDVVTEENNRKLLELKKSMNPSVDVVMAKYAVSEDKKGNPLFSYYRERTSVFMMMSWYARPEISYRRSFDRCLSEETIRRRFTTFQRTARSAEVSWYAFLRKLPITASIRTAPPVLWKA